MAEIGKGFFGLNASGIFFFFFEHCFEHCFSQNHSRNLTKINLSVCYEYYSEYGRHSWTFATARPKFFLGWEPAEYKKKKKTEKEQKIRKNVYSTHFAPYFRPQTILLILNARIERVVPDSVSSCGFV